MSIFYKITHQDGQESYLFGTAHCRHKDVTTLPIEVKYAFENASHAIFEANPADEAHVTDAFQAIVERWSDAPISHARFADYEAYIADVRQFNRNRARMEGRYFSAFFDWLIPDIIVAAIKLRDIPPIFTATGRMLGRVRPDSHDRLDDQLIKRALQRNYPVSFLENYHDQVVKIYGYQFSFEQQLDYYFFVKSYMERGGKIFHGEELMAAYLSQNIQDIPTTASSQFPDVNENEIPDIVKEYFLDLFTRRDSTLAESIMTHLGSGDVFIAIGAAHLQGVIGVLQSNGYQITPIETSERRYAVASSIEENHQINAFRKIYQALYAGQSSLFKSNNTDMLTTDDASVIARQASANPTGRTAKAWELAQQHFEHVSQDNVELFKSIHQYSYQNSSMTFFKRSQNFQAENSYDDCEQIMNQASAESRTGKICSVLGAGN